MDFTVFKFAVAKQFERMKKNDLFRTDVEKDDMWTTYLSSFHAGTDPILRKRTEHDCNCCKQFIRSVGNVVAVIDGKVESIWDIKIPSEPSYQAVADALSVLVKSKPIANIFLHYEKTAGTDRNFQQMTDGTITWNHFFVNIPPNLVVKNADIASVMAEQRQIGEVMLRSLKEITKDSIDTVLELIANSSLYRGDEHKFAVDAFNKLKQPFDRLKTDKEREIFAWTKVKGTPGSVAKIRNTSIGSLLVALSEGTELDQAVRAFEAMVAPANYKRPTALITKAMIDKAKEKLTELGLTSALERRCATINDITINNIMFANREARKVINGDIFDDLAASSGTKPKNLDKIEEVSIERFIADILPKAESLEVMMDNSHVSNLMSLIAPVDPTAGNLFKWDNKFSWSYNGDMADSIKERIKKAGGNVSGDLCCRLAWDYTDDLDFHMSEPGGHKIFFGNRRQTSPCGGILDIDANGGDGQRDDPAENIFYSHKSTMREGVYTLQVNNYNRRSDGKGFVVEIEFDGQVHSIGYEKVLRSGDTVTVAKIKYSKVNGFEIVESLPSSKSVRQVWNLSTNTFQKVNVMMLSPNHWDEKAIGNKHYFFMLEGCQNEGTARGFFNEFLKEELNVHRKVFEVVGSKMKVDVSAEQLSGLGFSSTQKNTLICRVKGSFTRIVKIIF